MATKILITGAAGQIGSELARALIQRLPEADLLVTDLPKTTPEVLEGLRYERLDMTDAAAVRALLERERPNQVYHLAALLSGTSETRPEMAWALNVEALRALFDSCLAVGVGRIFFPSSIAVFGPNPDRRVAGQREYLNPRSTYGITKLAGERLAEYYFHKHGLDVRSIRFPGLISYISKAGGGTTDYAVEVFYAALEQGRYTCFLSADTELPMMYMADALGAVMDLMAAPRGQLSIDDAYNIHGFTLTPRQVGDLIREQMPGFVMAYAPDFRQAIADSWPAALDDEVARRDWGFAPAYDASSMVRDMLTQLSQRLSIEMSS